MVTTEKSGPQIGLELGLEVKETALPVTLKSLPPPVARPVQWKRLREQLAILRESDPTKVLDAAYATGDAIGGMSEERLVRRFLASSEGQSLLSTRPSLTDALADHEALAALPDGSLGRAFLAFSRRQNLDPRALISSQHEMSRDYARLDPVRQWISDRLTVMHDLWHVVAGYDATNAGETALMCFSLPQRLNDRALPIFIAMSLFTGRIRARNVWQAIQRGRRARFLPAAPFEELLALPLDVARQTLGVSSPGTAHPGPNSVAMLMPETDPERSWSGPVGA
jgi:ubiquinone biosynthesis protein COQ4